jgi:O-antigen ligase
MTRSHAKARAGRISEQESWPARARWWVIVAFTVTLPLFISLQGDDTFRLPKELLMRAEAILIAALTLTAFISGKNGLQLLSHDRLTSTAVLSVVAAAGITTAFSTNRRISLMALEYTLALVIIFCGVYESAGGRSLSKVVAIGAAPAVVDAVLAVGQRLHWWSLFKFSDAVPPRERITALIGNPNEVGACLAISVSAAAAFSIVTRKPIAAAFFILLTAAVFASDALTSMIAITVSTLVMVWLMPRRVVIASTTALLMTCVVAFATLPPLRSRVAIMTRAVRTRDYDLLTSHRAIVFASAWMMFREHPFLGAGPGTFKFHYLPYRLRTEMLHPSYYLKFVQNVGEVHNDHLQVLSEEGVLGYASLVLCVVVIASRTLAVRNAATHDERARFVYFAALPLTVCWIVLALGVFPLELAVVMTPLLFFTACIMRWSRDATLN